VRSLLVNRLAARGQDRNVARICSAGQTLISSILCRVEVGKEAARVADAVVSVMANLGMVPESSHAAVVLHDP
jgi:hypothetical protein